MPTADPQGTNPPEPSTWHHVLGEMVHDNGLTRIETDRGPVICLDEATYAHLAGAAAAYLAQPPSRVLPTLLTSPAGPSVRLTNRELQVLHAMALGQTASEVADRLDVVLTTLAQHLVAICGKYQVHSTAEALTAARADGYLPPAPEDT